MVRASLAAIAAAAVAVLLASPAGGDAGDPVTGFGTGGTVELTVPGEVLFASGLASGFPDGGFAVSGTDVATAMHHVWRLDAAGAPVGGFASGGRADVPIGGFTGSPPARRLARDNAGRIVVGGFDADPAPGDLGAVARLDGTTGVLDPSFGGGDGIVEFAGLSATATTFVRVVATRPDGTILAIGDSHESGQGEIVVAELGAVNGMPTVGFGVRTYDLYPGEDENASDALMRPDGRILVAGARAASSDGRVVLIGTGGPLESYSGSIAGFEWDPAPASGDHVRVLAPGPGDTAWLAGPGGSTTIRTVRLSATGDPLDGAPATGRPITTTDVAPTALLAYPYGGLLLGSAADETAGAYRAQIQRLTADGVPDPGFGPGGARPLDTAPAPRSSQALAVSGDATGIMSLYGNTGAVAPGETVRSLFVDRRQRNATPTPTLAADEAQPPIGSTLALTATAGDADGPAPTTFAFDTDGNGTIDVTQTDDATLEVPIAGPAGERFATVTVTDALGAGATSAAVPYAVTGAEPTPTSATALTGVATVTGVPEIGRTLGCAAPPAVVAESITWLRDGSAVAQGATYTLTKDDRGTRVACRVDAGGISAASASLAVVQPKTAGAVRLRGRVDVGAAIACDTSTLAEVKQGESREVSWTDRAGNAVAGMSGAETVLPTATAQRSIRCTVSDIDANGNTIRTVRSDVSPVPGAPTIGPVAVVARPAAARSTGDTYTCAVTNVGEAAALRFEWWRNGTRLPGDGPDHTMTSDDRPLTILACRAVADGPGGTAISSGPAINHNGVEDTYSVTWAIPPSIVGASGTGAQVGCDRGVIGGGATIGATRWGADAQGHLDDPTAKYFGRAQSGFDGGFGTGPLTALADRLDGPLLVLDDAVVERIARLTCEVALTFRTSGGTQYSYATPLGLQTERPVLLTGPLSQQDGGTVRCRPATWRGLPPPSSLRITGAAISLPLPPGLDAVRPAGPSIDGRELTVGGATVTGACVQTVRYVDGEVRELRGGDYVAQVPRIVEPEVVLASSGPGQPQTISWLVGTTADVPQITATCLDSADPSSRSSRTSPSSRQFDSGSSSVFLPGSGAVAPRERICPVEVAEYRGRTPNPSGTGGVVIGPDDPTRRDPRLRAQNGEFGFRVYEARVRVTPLNDRTRVTLKVENRFTNPALGPDVGASAERRDTFSNVLPDLQLDGVEITQTVQDIVDGTTNPSRPDVDYAGVPLGEGTPTLVRAWTTVTSDPEQLLGRRPGLMLEGIWEMPDGSTRAISGAPAAVPASSPASPRSHDGNPARGASELLPRSVSTDRRYIGDGAKNGATQWRLPQAWTQPPYDPVRNQLATLRLRVSVNVFTDGFLPPLPECAICLSNNDLTIRRIPFTRVERTEVGVVRTTENGRPTEPQSSAAAFAAMDNALPGTVAVFDQLAVVEGAGFTGPRGAEDEFFSAGSLIYRFGGSSKGDFGVVMSPRLVGVTKSTGKHGFAAVNPTRPLGSVAHESMHVMHFAHASGADGGGNFLNDQTGVWWPGDDEGALQGFGVEVLAGGGYRTVVPNRAPGTTFDQAEAEPRDGASGCRPRITHDYMSYCAGGVGEAQTWISTRNLRAWLFGERGYREGRSGRFGTPTVGPPPFFALELPVLDQWGFPTTSVLCVPPPRLRFEDYNCLLASLFSGSGSGGGAVGGLLDVLGGPRSAARAAPRPRSVRARAAGRVGGAGPRAKAAARLAHGLAVAFDVARDGTLKSSRSQPVEGVAGTPAATAGARFGVRSLDATGRTLRELAVAGTPYGEQDVSGTYIEAVVPAEGVAAVALVDLGATGSPVIGQLARSAKAPTVGGLRLSSRGRLRAAGRLKVSWTAADADGDALRTTIESSSDGGRTWRAAVILSGKARTATVPGNTVLPARVGRGRLRVVVSDGFRTVTVRSGPLTFEGRRPRVTLSEPGRAGSTTKLAYGAEVVLRADARTALGGAIAGKAIRWADGHRRIGTGRRIVVRGLAPGTHRIVATARHAGASAHAALVVRVGRGRPALVAPQIPASIRRGVRSVVVRLGTTVPATVTIGRARPVRVGSRRIAIRVPVRVRRRGVLVLPVTVRAPGVRTSRGTLRVVVR